MGVMLLSYFLFLRVDALNCNPEWSSCSVTCGSGFRDKSRFIVQRQLNGGKPCDPHDFLTETCEERCCPGKLLFGKLIIVNYIDLWNVKKHHPYKN